VLKKHVEIGKSWTSMETAKVVLLMRFLMD
jgi:hypothetical protein